MRIARPPRPIRRVGLTPMIDVVFLLVAFFLIASTFSDLQTRDLLLGGADAGDSEQDATPVVVTLMADGTASIGGTAVPLQDLSQALARLIEQAPDRTVRIEVAEGLAMQPVIDAMDAAKAAGARAVRLTGAGRTEPGAE